ncbi:tat pathway signal sequence [Cordyceps javanica]|uniref:Tat pathway signal sequence n=1 Tax=Cordyceps javanica TaxID=43265 RepID=A0A545VHD4_9HYPO|nr:tat pathway signal sequence [Cordyceps javanica]TQW12289.1 tat pathway signal sequence [Cordyceps javanica]
MPTTDDDRPLDEGNDSDGSPLLDDSESAMVRKKDTISLELGILGVSLLLNITFIILLVVADCPHLSHRLHHGRWMDIRLYSPASESIENIPRVFRMAFQDDQSPYQGWPDDEKDQLWQDMYSKGMSIRIDEQAAGSLLNRTEHAPVVGIQHDYVVGLDVFHQLHCLNMIRQSIYPVRYNSSILHHCIEVLRESLTCAADVSAIPYRWHHETKIAEPDIRSVHMCRNFTKIREWAFGRFIPMTTKRKHVEDGVVVDYTGVGRDPEEVLAEELANPEGWNKTVNDL